MGIIIKIVIIVAVATAATIIRRTWCAYTAVVINKAFLARWIQPY